MTGPADMKVTSGKVVQTNLMSSEIKARYEGLLSSGDRLYDAGQLDAAHARWNEADALAEPYVRKPAERKEEKRPPPTAPDPAPPEFIPDTSDALAVCTSPDVCRSPTAAVPYMAWGKADDDREYSPDVRSNGLRIKRANSVITTTRGDEPGTGLGVKSNTVGDVIAPTSWSGTVFANGIPVERHGDTCTLNRGNCPGEYVHVKSTKTDEAPDGKDEADKKKAWYEHFWDGTKSTSDTAAAGGGAVRKLGEYWSDPSQIGRDASSAWESLPTPGEAWQGTQDFATGAAEGAAHVAGKVWNDPAGSARSAGGWVKDQAVGAYEGGKQAYAEGGVAQLAGAAVGVAAEVVNPLKKVRQAKRIGEALDEAGDIAKAERRAERATRESGDGARSTGNRRGLRNPCAPLAKGDASGKGDYRGGSYGGTKGVGAKHMESNHMPPKSVSPLGELPSPSMQMDKADHRAAMSTGSSLEAQEWRELQQEFIENGRYRDALAMDIKDVRRIAEEGGDITKYNQATRELLSYYKCLQNHGWLPGKK